MNYRELEAKDELLPLFDQAFTWPFNPQEFEETTKLDPRLQNSPIGYVAIENSHVVGFVGVMDIATRTLDGSEEKVGGIWGVATYATHARKGISTALMQRCHEYFKETNYNFSLLNTSKTFIAYAFYQKLGYKDARVYPCAYKLIEKSKKPPKKTREKVKLDWDRILEIYNQSTRKRTGFVVRSKQYLEMLETRERIQPEKSIVTGSGYALLRKDKECITVIEIVALTKDEINKLITCIEEKATGTIVDRAVLDENIQNAYQTGGYMVIKNNYNVLMAKPLTNKTFPETYGNNFYATSADFF